MESIGTQTTTLTRTQSAPALLGLVRTPNPLLQPELERKASTEGPISTLATAVTQTYQDTFVDGNHPWKRGIYREILSEMRHAIGPPELPQETALQKITLKCVQALQAGDEHPRDQYYRFLDLLRVGLATAELPAHAPGGADPARALLTRVCHARLTEVHIFGFLDRLVHMIISAGLSNPEAHAAAPLWEAILMEIEAIDDAPRKLLAQHAAILWGKIQGGVNINFDPHMQQNKPYVLADLTFGNRTVRWFRMGTPTTEGIVYRASIIPEFRCYLAGLQAAGKKHLYVNLQNPAWKLMGNECGRVEAIRALAKEFPGTFHCVTLAQDTEFYSQTGRWAVPQMSCASFKSDFIHQIFGIDPDDIGVAMPEALCASSFIDEASELMDCVAADLFPGESLSREERLDFIEVYYPALILLDINELEPDYLTIICKHAIDRAAKTGALLFYLIALLQGRRNNPQMLRQLRVFTHAAALTVKKQGLALSRRGRLTTALKRLVECLSCDNVARLSLIGDTPPKIIAASTAKGI